MRVRALQVSCLTFSARKWWLLAGRVGPQSRQPLVPAVEPEVASAAARGGAQAGPQALVVTSAVSTSAIRPGQPGATIRPVTRSLTASPTLPTIVVTGANP